jgi:hypothetical protein
MRSAVSRRFQTLAVLLPLFVLCGAPGVRGQGAGLTPGLNGALVRILGDHKEFTARLEIRMVDPKGRETFNAQMKFSLLDSKMRGDLDVTRLRSPDLPVLAGTAAKSVGLEEVVTLIRPDKQESYLIYPAFKACIVAPIDPEELDAFRSPATLQRTPLGSATLDGHPCRRNKVVISRSDGDRHEAEVWYATDMKDFPLQIETVDGADRVTLHFRQVKFEAPLAKDFDLPAGTDTYEDPQDLTKAVMRKLIGEVLGGGR